MNSSDMRVPAGWTRVRFDEIMRRVERKVILDDGETYDCVGVRWYGMGAFRRETLLGMDIARKQQWVIRAGDVLYNKLFAWKGSFAIADKSVDGCIVSDKFPTYAADPALVDVQFLAWYFRTPQVALQAQDLSKGAAAISKLTLNPPQFWDLTIPLPPLDEQRRIVARIEALAARIAEARGLKHENLREALGFWKVLSRIARSTPYPVAPLGDLVTFLDSMRVPLSEAERSNRRGPYPYYGASGVIDYVDGFLYDEELLLLSEDGANLINRSSPIAFITRGKYWVNNHAHVLRPCGVVDINFLAYALADYDVSAFNFASAQAKLNQANARKIAIPLPPIAEQRLIVAHLDALLGKVDKLKRLQAESSAELDALLPSVLDRAFRGEL